MISLHECMCLSPCFVRCASSKKKERKGKTCHSAVPCLPPFLKSSDCPTFVNEEYQRVMSILRYHLMEKPYHNLSRFFKASFINS